eukprot:361435_1
MESFEVVKRMEQEVKDTVSGFIRRNQQLFPSDNSYYNIPSLVHFICILYYHKHEYFTCHGNSISMNDNCISIWNPGCWPNSAYGKYVIDAKSNKIYKWRFKSQCDGTAIIGIDSSNKKHIDTNFTNQIFTLSADSAIYEWKYGGKKRRKSSGATSKKQDPCQKLSKNEMEFRYMVVDPRLNNNKHKYYALNVNLSHGGRVIISRRSKEIDIEPDKHVLTSIDIETYVDFIIEMRFNSMEKTLKFYYNGEEIKEARFDEIYLDDKLVYNMAVCLMDNQALELLHFDALSEQR